MAGLKPKILIQLDSDRHPSSFDRVVALDAGVDQIFSYGGVRPEDVQGLVYGAIFTRGPEHLKCTAVFIGGSDASVGARLLERACGSFFGPLRVSVLFDPGGANTTAAAAVLAAGQHLPSAGVRALVVGAGPVGQRVGRLLARRAVRLRVSSLVHAETVAACAAIRAAVPGAEAEPVSTGSESDLAAALEGVQLAVAAASPGVTVLPAAAWQACRSLRVAVDLNAVPPAGIEGVEPGDCGTERHAVRCFGAIAVGNVKMKVHKAAVAELFTRNDLVLDAEQLYELAERCVAVPEPD